MENIIIQIIEPFLFPIFESKQIYWKYLLTATLTALIIYIVRKPDSIKGTNTNFFSFIFPKKIYKHKSTEIDFMYFYVNTIFKSIVIIPLFAGSNYAITILTKTILDENVIFGAGVFPENNLWIILAFTLIFIVVLDFGAYISHFLLHKIPWLWEFHKVHHSAEVLSPVTVYRMHPVDIVLSISLAAVLSGIMNGIYQFLAAGEGVVMNVMGVNIFLIIFYFAAYNLRHSHIWLSYGPFWSQIFISPAQHQIHHSAEERHIDKNMGLIFAIWDKWADTLYVPKKQENFRLGIKLEDQVEFNSVFNLYLIPFKKLKNHFSRPKEKGGRKIVLTSLFAMLVFPAFAINVSNYAILPPVNKNIFLEDMTWSEVKDAIDVGYTTAIVPTGGVEQNGPHMILGKHNHVVRYTSGRIAEALGNTLVAPVVSYVPEGNTNPVEGHMRFPGTISVPEPVFESLLEHTAKSLKAHGFKIISFIGDSGGNQDSQQRVAIKLNKEWLNTGVKVIHVSDYYSKNGQVTYLKNIGRGNDEIGGHAGIRDTSELLAVYPNGIREGLLSDNRNAEFSKVGADGISSLASQEHGIKLIDLKIYAGLNQLRAFLR